MDEREDDDVECAVNTIPFVINKDLLAQYGADFIVTVNDKRVPELARIYPESEIR